MLFAMTVQFILVFTCVTQELSCAEQIYPTYSHAWNKPPERQAAANSDTNRPPTDTQIPNKDIPISQVSSQRDLHNDSTTIKLARFARLAVTIPAFVITTCYTIVTLIVCLTNHKDSSNTSNFSTILISHLQDRLPVELQPTSSNFCLGLIDSINPWLNFTMGLMTTMYLGSTLLIDACKLQRSPKRRPIYYTQTEDTAIG
jgi:hypothetical protein